MEIVKLEQKEFDLLEKALGKMKCKYCDVEITRDNFGFLTGGIYACDSELCICQAITQLEAEGIKIENIN